MKPLTDVATFSDRFVSRLQDVLGAPAVLHEPVFQGNEWKYVKDCLDTGWVSSAGQYVNEFERLISELTGSKHATAVVNGTAGLHVALKLLDVQFNDEVLVPALSFVAPANAVAYCHAIPHFVDSGTETLGVDPTKLESWLERIAELRGSECFNKMTGRRIRALIGVHVFGHPFDLDETLRVCRKFHVELIEDAAEALGSLHKEQHVGRWGKISVLSFNGNKTITTGGGGALLVQDEALARHAKHLTTTAKVPHAWSYVHDAIGYNYRLPNINAALGCAQMEQLTDFIVKKRALANRYATAFSDFTGVQFFDEPRGARSNFWLNAVLLDDDCTQNKDALLKQTNEAGFMTRPSWNLISDFEMFRNCPKMNLSCAEGLQKRLINLPSSATL